MQKALMPLAHLIRQHGAGFAHHPKATPHETQPWRVTTDATQPAASIKAILHIRPAATNDTLPRGGVRALGVVLVEGGQATPQTGDSLVAEGGGEQTWRIDTATPLGKAKTAILLEVILTGHAAQ